MQRAITPDIKATSRTPSLSRIRPRMNPTVPSAQKTSEALPVTTATPPLSRQGSYAAIASRKSSNARPSSASSITSLRSVSRGSSISSLASTGSVPTKLSKRSSRGSLAATPAIIDGTRQTKKPASMDEEIRPASFTAYQKMLYHKAQCKKCLHNRKSSSQATMPEQPSKIAVTQRGKQFPQPRCEHDELVLEDNLGFGAVLCYSYLAKRTKSGELVWVEESRETTK